jgi:hypothetical protein
VFGYRPRDLSASRIIASALGVFAGLSGLDHGFFEMLQGNRATDGLVIQAIGPDQRMWLHGTEEAFTIVPNFLATGILAVAAGVALIVLSVLFVDRPFGSRAFALLGALLFLVGGGIAQVWLVIVGWAVAARIGRPSRRLGRLRLSRALAGHWPVLLAVSAVLYLIALEIAIFGYVPGVSSDAEALAICWSSLGAMMILVVLTVLGGRAADFAHQPDEPAQPVEPTGGAPARRLGKVTAKRRAGSAARPKGA